MKRQPDIVFLVLDTQRLDRLSCYGYPLETSPHLDAFAADATRFTNAFAAAQWTIPSHSSMFTGLYPTAHTTVQSSSRLPDSIPTLAERLRAGGYHTAAFCNNPLVGVVNNGLRRGFDSFLNYAGLLTSRPNQAGVKPGVIGRYRQFFKRNLANLVQQLQDSFAHSDLLLRFAFTPLMVPLWQTALSFKGNTSKSLNDAAKLLIDRRRVAADQPIFTFINLMGVHLPYHPSRAAMQRFAPEVLRDRSQLRFLHRFNGDIYGWLAPLAGEIDAEHKALIDSMYNAEIATQDEHLGRFFTSLRESGTLDQTLVVVVADHGDHLGEKKLLGHLFSLYNELINVPLIIRDPAGELPRATTVAHPVSTRRLFQTVLSSAGIATPDEHRYSLAATASNPASDPDQGVVLSEGIPPTNVVSMIQRRQPHLARERHCELPRRAVVQDSYKLIQTGTLLTELYHLKDDPREQHNLAVAQPLRVQQMQQHFRMLQSGEAAAQIVPEHDPVLARRLRDLGYIE